MQVIALEEKARKKATSSNGDTSHQPLPPQLNLFVKDDTGLCLVRVCVVPVASKNACWTPQGQCYYAAKPLWHSARARAVLEACDDVQTAYKRLPLLLSPSTWKTAAGILAEKANDIWCGDTPVTDGQSECSPAAAKKIGLLPTDAGPDKPCLYSPWAVASTCAQIGPRPPDTCPCQHCAHLHDTHVSGIPCRSHKMVCLGFPPSKCRRLTSYPTPGDRKRRSRKRRGQKRKRPKKRRHRKRRSRKRRGQKRMRPKTNERGPRGEDESWPATRHGRIGGTVTFLAALAMCSSLFLQTQPNPPSGDSSYSHTPAIGDGFTVQYLNPTPAYGDDGLVPHSKHAVVCFQAL